MTALEWAISQEHYHVVDFLRRYSTLASSSKDSAPKVRWCVGIAVHISLVVCVVCLKA